MSAENGVLGSITELQRCHRCTHANNQHDKKGKKDAKATQCHPIVLELLVVMSVQLDEEEIAVLIPESRPESTD